jgi:wobble nucleotide-excising tRNase
MIKKIISIKNIGKIVNAPVSSELKKLNIIYGENGSGKTTLCAVMKSLKTGNTDYIKGRASFHTEEPPSVNILHEGGNARLTDTGWDCTLPNIEVFDSSFTAENVHAGHNVSHDHKKSLHDFVIGEEGIRLSDEIRAIDRQIREINSTILTKERTILRHIQGSISIDAFIALPREDDVDRKIAEKKTLISGLEKAEEVKTKSKLVEILMPAWEHDTLKSVLERTLEDVSKEAEELIKRHIDECLDVSGERWLSYGLEHIKDDKCPFCKQNINDIELVNAYKQYFNEAYSGFKSEVSSALLTEKGKVSVDIISKLIRQFSTNETLLEYWRPHISTDISLPAGLSEQLESKWRILANEVNKVVEAKFSNLLEKIDLPETLKEASEALDELRRAIGEYNNKVREVNELIQRKKDAVEAGDLRGAREQLMILENQKKRHEHDVNEICSQYSAAKQDKTTQERLKEEKKGNLDTVTNEIISRYQEGINSYLARFGADFKIVNTGTQYTGGTPSVNYKIQIGGKTVPVGDSNTPNYQPSFRNTLSDGDKNTLAFAFFMAKLDLKADLSSTIIVLDDPINSLDINRRKATAQEVIRKTNTAKQVILLTHDPVFARTLFDSDRVAIADKVCLCLKRDGDYNNIQNWDIENETASDFFRNYCKLEKYIADNAGDPHDVAKCIRPVLEGHLRRCFPIHFKSDRSLGQYLGDIRTFETEDSIGGLKRYIDDLSDINEYATEVAHDDCDSSLLNDATLRSYIDRALRFMGR